MHFFFLWLTDIENRSKNDTENEVLLVNVGGADIQGNSGKKNLSYLQANWIVVFTVHSAISVGISHINVSGLVKSISTLISASHLPKCIVQIFQKRFTCCDFVLFPRRMGWCSSWKYISFFGKIAVSLMFNPGASVVMVPANSILIIQSGYSFYNWTTKTSDRCGQGNLKARWHKEIKFIFCQNQIFKKWYKTSP